MIERVLSMFSTEQIEEKLQFIRQYQRYIYIALVAYVCFFVVNSLILPGLDNLEAEQTRLSKFEAVFQKKRAEVPEKAQLLDAIAALKQTLDRKQNQFFSQGAFEGFGIHTLPQLAKRFGVSVSSVGFRQSESVNDQVDVYPVELRLTGDFHGLYHLFETLESYDKLILIRQFNLSRRSTNPVTLDCQIVIGIYVQKEDTQDA